MPSRLTTPQSWLTANTAQPESHSFHSHHRQSDILAEPPAVLPKLYDGTLINTGLAVLQKLQRFQALIARYITKKPCASALLYQRQEEHPGLNLKAL